jgi:rhamnulokinase
VEAGPVEATALGNVLAQLIASGEITSLAEGRELLRNSFEISVHEPMDTGTWDAKAQRFEEILGL